MYFTPMTVQWSYQTLFFYIGIIGICYIIAVNSRYFKWEFGTNGLEIPLGMYTIAFILILVKGLCSSGRDLRSGYYINFMTASSLENFRDYTLEIGYRLLNVLIYKLIGQFWVLVFVMSILTVTPVVYIIWKYRNEIDVPAAIVLYTCVFYFNGFSPFRNYLAASIALLAFDAIVRKRKIKALIWIFVAICFHRSMLFLLLPFVLIHIKEISRKTMAVGLASAFLLVYVGRMSVDLTQVFGGRYANYLGFAEVSIGMQQFIYYGPLLVLYYVTARLDKNKWFSRVSFAYLSSGLFFGMLGYVISIFGRMETAFLPIIIIVPYYIKLLRNSEFKYKRALDILFGLYCLARFMIFIIEYYALEDIMPYTTWFGLVL